MAKAKTFKANPKRKANYKQLLRKPKGKPPKWPPKVKKT